MKYKLKAWLIHALGGVTTEEAKKREDYAWERVGHWRNKFERMVSDYGREKMFHVVRKINVADYRLSVHCIEAAEKELQQELLHEIIKTPGCLWKGRSEMNERQEIEIAMAIRVLKQ